MVRGPVSAERIEEMLGLVAGKGEGHPDRFVVGAPARGREGEVNIARYHSGTEGLAVTVTVTGNPERLKDYDTAGKPIAQRIVRQLLDIRG